MPTNVTIREAAKLRSKIENRLAELRNELYVTRMNINLLDPDPLKEVNEAPEKIRNTFAKFTTLAGVLVTIRRQIDAANHVSPGPDGASVSDLLAEIASLKSQAQVIAPLTSSTPRLSDEQLNARVEGHRDLFLGPVVDEDDDFAAELDSLARRRPRRRRAVTGVMARGGETMTVEVLPQDMINTFKTSLKTIQNITEKLHSRVEKLNNSVIIAVSDEAVSVLAANEITV